MGLGVWFGCGLILERAGLEAATAVAADMTAVSRSLGLGRDCGRPAIAWDWLWLFVVCGLPLKLPIFQHAPRKFDKVW